MERWYLETHEWARADAAGVAVGLSSFAAQEIGDIIHIELPAVGRTLQRGDVLAEIESMKSVNEIYAPISGRVEAVNQVLVDRPELVNQDPLGAGWLARIAPEGPDPFAGLMDEASYSAGIRP